MVVYSSDGKTYSSHEEARAAAGISSGTNKSSSSSSSGSSTTQTSSKTSSNSAGTTSSSPSSQSLSNEVKNITVQPEFISSGNGGVTYRVIDENGKSHGIAVSGRSAQDAANEFANKATMALARGDTAKAEKYQQSAAEFQAVANYEQLSGVMDVYGKSTGITYDASSSLKLTDSAKVGSSSTAVLGNTAYTYPTGKSLTDSTPTETLAPMEVSSILGGTVKKENSSTSSNSSNSLTESSGAGSPTASAPEAPSNFDMFMTMGSDLVDSFANLPDTLMNSGTLPGAVGGFAATALLPNDLVKTIKKASDGNADEITGWDIAYSAADVLGLIPFVGLPFKAVKAAVKGTKVAGALSGALTLGTSITETVTADGDNDSPVKNALSEPKYLGNGVYAVDSGVNLSNTATANKNAQLLANALDTATVGGVVTNLPWMSESGAWVSQIDEFNQANTQTPTQNITVPETPTQNPTTPQNHTQPEQNTEYDLSSLQDSITKLFAGAGGNGGTVVGGGGNPMMPYYIAGESGGGSGDVTVVTNGAQPAQPVDYSGVFQYIVPVAVIIGIIIVAVALIGKNKKKGGASA